MASGKEATVEKAHKRKVVRVLRVLLEVSSEQAEDDALDHASWVGGRSRQVEVQIQRLLIGAGGDAVALDGDFQVQKDALLGGRVDSPGQDTIVVQLGLEAAEVMATVDGTALVANLDQKHVVDES